ncbi:MAG: hypothetical protein AAB215_02835 [Planctomycetota bacterium]
MASSSGPENVIEADAGARKKSHRDVCLEQVLERPGCTAAEIGAAAGMNLMSVSRRLPELRRFGLVRNGRSRICSIAKRLSLTWFPVEANSATRLA